MKTTLTHKCTCNQAQNTGLSLNAYDPTRTLSLRNQFVREMIKRFAELRGVIRQAIIEDDAFGLMPGARQINTMRRNNKMFSPGRNAFAYSRNVDKVKSFVEWLEDQEKRGILENVQSQLLRGLEGAWTDRYIFEGYKRGVIRARQELKRAGYKVPSLAETGGIGVAMQQPFHAERVSLLSNRAFSDLKGVTDAMSGQISRVLSQGMAEGKNPREIARLLARTITGPSGDLALTDTLGRFIPAQRRVSMIARTEIIRAHTDATLQEFKSWRVEEVLVKAEFTTAGDDRVCPECEALEGKEYTLEEAEGIIPVHPSCRCVFLPKEIS
jgi:SPP1 gp7 family putative phage head morphogenesis protein